VRTSDRTTARKEDIQPTGSVGFAPMILDRGYALRSPDGRAHGESGSDLVTYGLLERYDVLDWAHWLLRFGCTQLYGLGESLGASVLIEATALEPVFRAAVAVTTSALLSRTLFRGPHGLRRRALCDRLCANFASAGDRQDNHEDSPNSRLAG